MTEVSIKATKANSRHELAGKVPYLDLGDHYRGIYICIHDENTGVYSLKCTLKFVYSLYLFIKGEKVKHTHAQIILGRLSHNNFQYSS